MNTATNMTAKAAINSTLWAEAVKMAKEQLHLGKVHYSELQKVSDVIYKKLLILEQGPSEVPSKSSKAKGTDEPQRMTLLETVAMKQAGTMTTMKAEATESKFQPIVKVVPPRIWKKTPLTAREKKEFATKCIEFLKTWITRKNTVFIEERGNHSQGLTNRFRVCIKAGSGLVDITKISALVTGQRYTKANHEVYIHGFGIDFATVLTSALSTAVFGNPTDMKFRIN